MPQDQQDSLLAELTDEEKAHLAYKWRGWIARPDQLPPDGDWRFWVVLAGRGFGKTRLGAEWVREQVKTYERVGLIGKDSADMRSVMIEGESGILAICDPWERPEWKASKRELRWPNGAISECRTGEDPEGVRGVQFHRFWADEIAAWQYPQDTWDQAVLGLRLPPDPRALVTTTPKPIRLLRTLIEHPHSIVTKGSTYDNLSNLGATFDDIIRQYEGIPLGRQELHAELLWDQGLAYPDFSRDIHVMPDFRPPPAWERFESFDFGQNNPTAWLLWAVDYDGNLYVIDEYYSPGYVSEHAAEIKRRRTEWWERKDEDGWTIRNAIFGDPSINNKPGIENKLGDPASVATAFADHGIAVGRANNNRVAGYVQLSELFRRDPERTFPIGHKRHGQTGAPRLFVCESCEHTISQVLEAPLEEEGRKNAGEAIGEAWEGAHGHAHAALRYGAMSRARPSAQPADEPGPDATVEELRADYLKRRLARQHKDPHSLDYYLTL